MSHPSGAGIELRVLGAGPAYSDRPGAIGSSYLLVAGGSALVLDLGHGAYSALAAAWDPASVEAVVVSHLHPDHFIDLVPLRHHLRWGFDPPRRARVLGPAALADRLDLLHADPGFAAHSLDIEPLTPGIRRLGPFMLETSRVAHTDESYGFRITAGDGGRGLVYSGDCGRADDLLPLIREGDVLLAEASFGPGPGDPAAAHLDGPAVGRVAATAGVGQVLLTHLLDWRRADETVASCRREFGGPVRLVWPGDRIAI